MIALSLVTVAALGGCGWLYFDNRRLSQLATDRELDRSDLQVRLGELEEAGAKHQAELERALNRAGAARRAKSTFLANMSHELRTPLNAVIGYSEMLLEELDGDNREDVRRIRGAAHKLLSFVGDVLELAKMEVGDVELVAERVSMVKLLEEAVQRHCSAAAARSNQVEFVIGDDPGAFLTDAKHLQIAMDVLLDNAVKFCSQGTIRVEARFEMRRHKLWWRIAVSDTGCGMDEAELDRLFEPFGMQETALGVGLGLPRAQRFVQLLGGNLFVTSSLGEGATFTIEVPELDETHRSLSVSLPPTGIDSLVDLPSQPDASTEAVVSAIAVQAGAPRGPVLLVEDDPDARRLLAKALRAAGLIVHEAHNGVEALDALERMRFAVVLLDLLMPEMDGFAVLEAIHANPRLAGLPVMVCTAMDLDVGSRARLRGADVLKKRDLHDPVHIIRRVRSELATH